MLVWLLRGRKGALWGRGMDRVWGLGAQLGWRKCCSLDWGSISFPTQAPVPLPTFLLPHPPGPEDGGHPLHCRVGGAQKLRGRCPPWLGSGSITRWLCGLLRGL